MAVCEAIHPSDRTECEGPPDAVRISDPSGGCLLACVHHGSRVLATVTGSTVEPASQRGAAIEAFRRAKETPPLAWQWDDEPMSLVEYAVWKGITWESTRDEIIRHAVMRLRFRIPGVSQDRAFLIGTGQIEAGDADLVLIADALGLTVEQLLAGGLPE